MLKKLWKKEFLILIEIWYNIIRITNSQEKNLKYLYILYLRNLYNLKPEE